MQTKLSLTERLVLILASFVVATAFVLLYANPTLFEWYIQEDGPIEWMTVIGLLLGSFICFGRFFRFLRKRKPMFLFVTFLLGLMLFLVAGEEISWGQRIFNLTTPEYFQEHNLQKETNFHNLLIGGVKINQVVFSLGLITVLAVYLLLFPFFYRRSVGFRKWINNWGIVLPKTYQVLAFLLVFGITALLRHDKNAEVLECGAALLFYLIVRYPLNREILFRPTSQR